MGSGGKTESKKAYQPPVLIVYGTVQGLTQGVYSHGTQDSATSLRRTSLA
jgi:hypothetical protein